MLFNLNCLLFKKVKERKARPVAGAQGGVEFRHLTRLNNSEVNGKRKCFYGNRVS